MSTSIRESCALARVTKVAKRRLCTLALALTSLTSSFSQANEITINHANITAGASVYASADGKITLTPFATGGGAGVFGSTSGCCIGVQGGANNSAIGDADGSPLTVGDREWINVALASDAALTDIGFIFTRANGPLATDGIVISGFASNPMAALDPAAAAAGVTATFDAGSLYVKHGWRGGAVSMVSFANSAASLGQTLVIGSNDSGEPAPQVVINTLSYAVVPEPASLALASLAAAFIIRRRN